MPTPTRPSTCCVSVQPRPDAPMVRCAACGSPESVFAVSPEGDLVEHLPGRSVTLARDAAGWPEGLVMVGSSVLYVSGGVVYEVVRPKQVFPSTAAGAPTRGQVVALLPVDPSG